MDEISPPETRARSRSKTPFLRSNCEGEECAHVGEDHMHHHRKKSPIKKNSEIQTIIEEVNTERTAHSEHPYGQAHVLLQKISSSNKVTTSDYSSDESPEIKFDKLGGIQQQQQQTVIVTKTQTISSNNYGNSTSHFGSGAGGNYTSDGSTNKQTSFAILQSGRPAIGNNRSKEISQNEMNSAFEHSKYIKTSTPILSTLSSSSASKTTTQQISSATNGDLSNHIAYKEYKDAGEYWKKYPKTDYTYSKLSPHRRELAPGIVAMPNMSRKSLDKHQERVNYMVQRNPTQEVYIRKRYQGNTESFSQAQNLVYDSQDETDLKESSTSYRKYRDYRYSRAAAPFAYTSAGQTSIQSSSIVTRTITRIVSLFYSFISLFWDSNANNLYYTKIEENQGIFGRIRSAISSGILKVFRVIYLLISSVLYLDTWLLRSHSPDNHNRKRFLLLLLLLLPLLLLSAWNHLEDNERNALILRYQNLLPIPLLGLRSIFTTKYWKDLFTLNAGILFLQQPESSKTATSSSQFEYSSITNNFQKSLNPEEYNSIINHINIYVEKLVDDKLLAERQKQKASRGSDESQMKITKEMSTLIANIVQQHLIDAATADDAVNRKKHANEQFELSPNDIEKITSIIRVKLQAEYDNNVHGKFSFSQDNLEEISKLIKQNIEINYRNYNFAQHYDLNEIIFKILESPKLSDFIDNRIMRLSDKDVINRQKIMIDELNNEISQIKGKFLENLNIHQKLQDSIDVLKSTQDNIANKIEERDKAMNTRFDSLLAEIDLKMKNLNDENFTLLNKQVKLYLLEILGYNTATAGQQMGELDEIDLKNWIRNTFVAKEFLEEKLREMSIKINVDIKNDIMDNSGAILMEKIGDKLKMEILKVVELKQSELMQRNQNTKMDISTVDVKKIVRDILAVYDADKTGLVDYALESAGGQVISTRCTENYQTKSAQISIFGIPLWYPSNTPRIAISPAVQPGECWAFQGFPGFLVIKLNSMVFVSGFTMEHIPKSLAPNGRIDSAPQNFTVWGLNSENDQDPILFGEYEYNDNGSALQYFPVQNKAIRRPFEVVELRIESNHGNVAYTCLYRFRVHGTIAS